MLKDRIITEEEVSYNELATMRSIRNSIGFPMKDDELLKFYVEWNNICFTLKHGKRGNRQC